VRALRAGADLLCLGTTRDRDDEALYRSAHAAVTAAVRSGRLGHERLAEAIARTARLRCESRAVRRPAWAEAEARLEEVGARAARRAVRWIHSPAPLTADAAPAVLDLRTRLDHAAGRIAPHLVRALHDAWPGAVDAGPGAIDLWQIAVDAPRTRPVVLLTRDAASDPAERDRLTTALTVRPDAVVLHAGTAASAPAARHVLLTWGVGRANARATVEALRA